MAPARKEQTPPEVPENDEDYHSSSDEDFNPDDAPAEEELSSSEDEVAPPPAKGAQRGRKRKQLEEEEDAFDSGDEETIRERKRAKRRKRKGEVPKGDEDEGVMVFSDDEGGEGGLIRTRAQRMREYVGSRTVDPRRSGLTRVCCSGRRSEDLLPRRMARRSMWTRYGRG